jgi:hypothetical protein
MRKFIVEHYDLIMDSRKNPLNQMDLASQHYIMQVLAWMWSMVFSLSFVSIFYFHFVWGAHVLMLGGICFTVGIFRRAEQKQLRLIDSPASPKEKQYSHASTCIWKLDREA